MPNHCQVCVLGSGFAGSILLWILARRGLCVVVVDRSVHPRFAIGESSTPLADFLLRQIAKQFGVPELHALSSWGKWQAKHPDLRCGLKRGFSYYQHEPHTSFSDDAQHSRSYLVAASASDDASDTHWHRADVDAWLLAQARVAGADVLEGTQVQSIVRIDDQWEVRLASISDEAGEQSHATETLRCEFVVDASGAGGVVGRQLGLARLDDSLLTRTGSVFGHFRGVGRMAEELRSALQADDPFPCDAAAQHHLLADCRRAVDERHNHAQRYGWMWMLRMQDDITSVGLTVPESFLEGLTPPAAGRYFHNVIDRYPTIRNLLAKAHLIAPHGRDGQPELSFAPRVSRLWAVAAGDNWCMLPSTVGVVDPLHSTGIAHALSGVHRASELLCQQFGIVGKQPERPPRDAWSEYSRDVIEEVRWIDEIVHLCYRALEISFDTFVAVSSLYFVAAVHSERSMLEQLGEGQLAKGQHFNQPRDGFLLTNNTALRQVAAEVRKRLSQSETESTTDLAAWIREAIAPWNDFGLLEAGNKNRVHRSQTKA